MKHAILMMAHGNEEVVRTALRMLDDPRFTIFLLADKKQKVDIKEFIPNLRYADIEVLTPIEINWASYSQIEGELQLLKACLKKETDYCHFLQGADLPLKTPEEIDRYFIEHAGENFLIMQPEKDEFARYKAACKHFFVGCKSYRTNKILKGLRYILAFPQKFFVDKKNDVYYHSSALFSISAEFARYVIAHENDIYRQYRYSLAGDEVFLSTLLMTSVFSNTLAPSNGAHFIDWERNEGNSPRTFTMEDVELLKEAIECKSNIFARKFSQDRDIEIVRKVEEMVSVRKRQ